MQRINKTMDKRDLFTEEGSRFRLEIYNLIQSFLDQGLPISGWHGVLTSTAACPEKDSRNCERPGGYIALPDAPCDAHFPWFLYWEIYWALKHTPLRDGAWILDAGGACSLFWAYLCNLRKYKVCSCELQEDLVKHANTIAKERSWGDLGNLNAFSMSALDDVTKLKTYQSDLFDAVFSICVMEHLTIHQRRRSIRQFHRILKPGGTLTITFDYRNPRPAIFCPDPAEEFIWKEQLMSTPEQVRSSFLLDEGLFDVLYNQEFWDRGTNYLGHPRYDYAPYTFGALFLKRR